MCGEGRGRRAGETGMSSGRVSVLIVHSDEGARAQCKEAVAVEVPAEDYDILEVATGEEGVALCREHQPGCVIVGEKLADMTATAFLDQIADDSGYVHTPVVVVLAKRTQRAAERALDAGAIDVFSIEEVPAILGRVARYAADLGATEQRLAEQRVLFRSLLTGVSGFLALKNGDLRYEAVNPAFCQFVAKAPEEITGLSDADLFTRRDVEALEALDREVLESGSPRTDVQELRMGDCARWLEISRSPITDVNGETTGLLWTARDFTDLKEMEEAVRADREHYRQLGEDQQELACRFDPALMLTFVSDSLCRFLEKEREELIGTPFLSVLPEEEQEAMQQHLAGLSAETPVAEHEMGTLSASGTLVWQRWTTRALFDNEGSAIGYQAVGIDITEAKRAEDVLAKHQETLAALETELGAVKQAFETKQAELADQAGAADERMAEAARLLEEKDGELERRTAERDRLQAEMETAQREAREEIETQKRDLE
ncbi:MAG TPA: PAS domain S-box protein, partial [Candidatus Hydrogenedentes bacterium]|nr:PAS domain S-box protein [Candidatus Hydrogenedentota bacterium]